MLILPDRLGKVVEKIMPEDARYTPKQKDIDVLFPKYLVYIGAGATQLFCKPSHSTPLFVERLVDMPPNVEHNIHLLSHPDSRHGMFFSFNSGTGRYRKGAGILPSPVPSFKAFACPPIKNGQRRKPTPICICSITPRQSEKTRHEYTHHEDVTGCHLPFDRFKVCEVLKLESQTPVNVFSIFTHKSSPSLELSAEMCKTKLRKKNEYEPTFHSFS